MKVVQAVGNAVLTGAIPDPETESARGKAMASGVFMLIGSIFVLVFFWASLVFPIVLVCFSLTTSILLMVHCSNFTAVTCCCSGDGAFSAIRVLCIIQSILALGCAIWYITLISWLLPYPEFAVDNFHAHQPPWLFVHPDQQHCRHRHVQYPSHEGQ